jgi:cyclopropane fatty-acyl-phospholipid synthase-like methyltransferase
MRSRSYNAEFFASHQEVARQSARVIVPLVLALVPFRSVLDVGCGMGTWLSVFRQHGADDVVGIDGDYVDSGSLEIEPKQFLNLDLTQTFSLRRNFDLVVSLEVAEHLPENSAEDFIASLVAHGPVVLFSAAIPHQGGLSHVNEQWPGYWATRFLEHGYLPVDCIRRKVWEHRDVAWWYAQNILVYVSQKSLVSYPVLKSEHERCGGATLPLVHPRRYLEWVEWGLEQCGTV